MSRVSRAQTEVNYQRILHVAARMVRELGAAKLSIPEVMNAAGLTHGGFYRHFASKDDLVAQAGAVAFAERSEALEAEIDRRNRDAESRAEGEVSGHYKAYLGGYVAAAHRDDPGTGCAAAALAFDAAHFEGGEALKEVYASGVKGMITALEELAAKDGAAPAAEAAPDRTKVLVDLATVVGGITLARATRGDEISDEILNVIREHVAAEATTPVRHD
ncbi:TetR/AcrR family transcriptional regulator [Streptomyces sp. NPDC059629]|uniref:TetR/AcrR family transcriptional regulator n=1 Tax=Streptomyces sp. NPDC059629 TaxID=3346889 RepID=UPI00368ED9EB